MRALQLAAVAVVVWWAPGAAAEVRLEVRPDGTKVMVNTDDHIRRRSQLRRQPSGLTSEMRKLIRRHAAQQRLEPDLVQAVIHVESGYDAGAVSAKGAMGLMQLMPGTAREYGVRDAFDPEDNVRAGSAYLRRQLDSFGKLELALAAYNAGPRAVLKYGGVPPYAETHEYVRRVFRMLGRGEPGLPRLPARSSGGSVYLFRGPDQRLLMSSAAPAAERR